MKKIKRKVMPVNRTMFSVNEQPAQRHELFEIEIKDEYRLTELLAYKGRYFVPNVCRAIFQGRPDPKLVEKYNSLFSQGILSKQEIIVDLRFSPAGEKINVSINGLRSARLVLRLFKLPVLGTIARICACIYRLPLLVRNIQRIDYLLEYCREELEVKVDSTDYINNMKRISLAFQMTEQRMIDLLQEFEGKNDSSNQ